MAGAAEQKLFCSLLPYCVFVKSVTGHRALRTLKFRREILSWGGGSLVTEPSEMGQARSGTSGTGCWGPGRQPVTRGPLSGGEAAREGLSQQAQADCRSACVPHGAPLHARERTPRG